MKDKLITLLESCMENGTDADLSAIEHFLKGIQKTSNEERLSLIDKFFHTNCKLDERTCEITIPLNPALNNSFEIVHGGVTATLLDTAMGTLANYLLPEGFGAVTNQLNIHYIAPGIGPRLRCHAELIHQGKKTFVLSGEVYREDGKKIAYATGTFFVIKK
ncbi:thioesterase [Bacillus sp. MUM 116]|uniref:PaaI family thioesterase n=1 Tax=Bacillus sp. MUM 116 TaxID=1678002 RepID=UPI0008F5BA82|nr:PaaI family thioesterase [Bacillus sp. MUM 116]OIK14066.1 thioesterase [Bacillus sp. MUM 116]